MIDKEMDKTVNDFMEVIEGITGKRETLWHDADGDYLPAIDREVIVLDKHGKVCFAHRPVESYTAVSLINHSEMEEYYPEKYGSGGWNIPDVEYWLDIEIPELRFDNVEDLKRHLDEL